MGAIELFAGAGAIETALVGFGHEVVVVWDQDACETIWENQARGVETVGDWPIFEGDVRSFDYSRFGGWMDLVKGGHPCQPFPLGGNYCKDERDPFSEVVRAVAQVEGLHCGGREGAPPVVLLLLYRLHRPAAHPSRGYEEKLTRDHCALATSPS